VELTVGRTPRAIYSKGDVGIVVEHGVPRRDGSIARGGPIDRVRVVGIHRVWPRRAGVSEHRLSLSMSSYGWPGAGLGMGVVEIYEVVGP